LELEALLADELRGLGIAGYDRDRRAIHAALENLDRAGLRGVVQIERRELSAARPRKERGLLVANPPYGERLGEASELPALYAELGGVLQQQFLGWKASVFTGIPAGHPCPQVFPALQRQPGMQAVQLRNRAGAVLYPHEDETGLSEEARVLRKLMRRALSLAHKPPSAGAEMCSPTGCARI
jgi:23S rRNA (guanine2445-N2)-methyltransferase / 23S rRNA (guanine2069-N7)-methyltransferase